ncbi:MAG: hypothetical protein GXO70_01905 [Acidobacteria bacterium]|nr:hypothetical protein [Acidobacteriota bacterium]
MRSISRLILVAMAVVLAAILSFGAEECTIGVASGRVTNDGRPILWKNRDIPPRYRNNDVRFIKGERYNFLALMTVGYERYAWAGNNVAGFCLVNAASSDLSGTSKSGPGNGEFLKMALGRCASVSDFERLLQGTNWPGRRTNGNFAVIDATGAAVLFEIRNYSYTRFDANNPEVAPDGFLVRSNFALTSDGSHGKVRYKRANALWREAAKTDTLSASTVLKSIATDLADEYGNPYPLDWNSQEVDHTFAIPTNDTINRGTTAATIVFTGIKEGESPDFTTMWCALGQPILTPCVPVWAAAGEVPSVLTGEKGSSICHIAMNLQDAFSYAQTEKGKIIHFLSTPNLSSTRRMIESLNRETIARTTIFLTSVRGKAGYSPTQFAQFQEETGENVVRQYECMAKTLLKQRILKVGVYGDGGASPVCVTETVAALEIDGGMVPVVVHGTDIQSGILDSLDVIVFPGGSGSKESCSMGSIGREKVREFILKKGKGCVGICAGGYLLSTSPNYPSSLNLISAAVYDSAHYNRGRGLIEVKLTEAGGKYFPELLGRKSIFIQYYDGPVLVPATDTKLPAYTELGQYVTDIHLTGGSEPGVSPGKTALLLNKAGNGRVFTIVGHPEATPGMRWMIPRMVRIVAGRKLISYPETVVRPERETKAILFDKARISEEYRLFWKLFSDSPGEKITALDALIAMRSRPSLRWAIGLLRDVNPDVRAHAAAILAEAEYTPCLNDLAIAIRFEKDPKCLANLKDSFQKLSAIIHCSK